ncbi:TetR/AcrR family transcriptional regulator [[Mycobacterium] burgundiense]|uniref:TetR/AcrR family transcriptional regulator n=1 Tax=[Mycobacterium] burgundiense TaxID=3064286 RepID=A0ABM9LIC0_9MYCO|nr:TetR/AcrR family transcriptional regulator [Mycolicibacterium sp. MU0053]CAJ1499544.1 TetR/AcrR family transcriptional regulator [Mycolicibacterium sp. MU0053]
MAAAPRRVGAETSKTRDALLDCVEQLLLDTGYASISYRALASEAGVTPSLVQYYFPTLDDIFLSAIRRYSERNLEYLTKTLRENPDDPLKTLWNYNQREATGAMMTEFMALGNHRKSIQAEIAKVTKRMRKVQVDALAAKYGKDARLGGDLSLSALQLLMSGIPKFLSLEEGVGVKTAHKEVTAAFEKFLESLDAEPATPPTRGGARRR